MRKLLEKILRANVDCGDDFESKRTLCHFIKSAVAVDCSRIEEYSATLPDKDKKQFGYLWQMTPCHLPFNEMWLEWPVHMMHGNGHETMGTAGALLREQDNRIVSSNIVDAPEYPKPMMISFGVFRTVNDTTINDAGVSTWKNSHMDYSDESLREDSKSWINIISLSLAFFSCRNIQLQRINNRKHAEHFKKKYGIFLPDFHIIEIHKNMTRTEQEQIQREGKPTLQHARLIRGHMKHYSEDSKLFGKITGNWWWEPHVRGTIGTPIVSDYRVWPPSEDHKPYCIS